MVKESNNKSGGCVWPSTYTCACICLSTSVCLSLCVCVCVAPLPGRGTAPSSRQTATGCRAPSATACTHPHDDGTHRLHTDTDTQTIYQTMTNKLTDRQTARRKVPMAASRATRAGATARSLCCCAADSAVSICSDTCGSLTMVSSGQLSTPLARRKAAGQTHRDKNQEQTKLEITNNLMVASYPAVSVVVAVAAGGAPYTSRASCVRPA